MNRLATRYGKWALVTGASAGIGLQFARSLAAEGLNLVLVARRRDLLTARAAELASEFGIEATTIVCDLTEEGAVDSLFQQLTHRQISLVVLNAGAEATGHFTKVSLERHVRLQRLNIEVPLRMASLFGRAMVDRGRGGLIFVASLFGYQGVPLMANYAASKAYILSLGEALNAEMKQFGVDVLVVSPGMTETDMTAKMPVDFRKMPITRSSPQQVVCTALGALGKKATVVPGLLNKFYAWQNRLVPRSWPVKLFGFLLGYAMHRDARSEHLHQSPRAASS